MLKNSLKILTGLLFSHFFVACMTPNFDEQADLFLEDPSLEGNQAELSKKQASEKRGLDQAALLALINKLAVPEAVMTENDWKIIQALPLQPNPASLEEAAIGFGIVYYFLKYMDEKRPKFEEADLHVDVSAEHSITSLDEELQSIEELAVEKKYNFAAALTQNQLLKSYKFQVDLLQALKLGKGQSVEFVHEVKQIVMANAQQWGSVEQEFWEKGNKAEDEIELSEDNSEGQIAPALPFGGESLGADENLLEEAQAYADQGDFKLAVEKLRKFSKNSLFYAAAVEKIKEFSNIAVHDLRRKAAQAFQSAKPIADRNVRASYLEKAKEYLESAIQLYPEADQISRVKQNLEVISKNLDVISEQSANNAFQKVF